MQRNRPLIGLVGVIAGVWMLPASSTLAGPANNTTTNQVVLVGEPRATPSPFTLTTAGSGEFIVYQAIADSKTINDPWVYYDQEYGDEITLDLQGNQSAILTKLILEYWNDFTSTPGSYTVTVRLRKLDGPVTPGSFGYPTPGTVIFDSGELPLDPSGTMEINLLSAGPITVSDGEKLAWTVDFSDNLYEWIAGLWVADNVTVGSSEADFWVNDEEGWKLYHLEGPANFAVTVLAVPEPATISLLALGLGLVTWFGLRSYRR